jgi:hypothetical protein
MPRTGQAITGGRSSRAITARDEDIAEVVTAFLHEMPGRMVQFERLWEQQRFDELRRAAGDLEAIGVGIGFGDVASAAGKLERRLTDLGNGRSAGGEIDSLRREFGVVVKLCRGVTGVGEAKGSG